MSEFNPILTPVGRLVSGSASEPQKTDAEGRPLVIKTGPNAGQPRVDYYLGVAIPKNDPGWPAFQKLLVDQACLDFPQYAQQFAGKDLGQILAGQAARTISEFAFKIVDGDSQQPNKNGKIPCQKEGYPGNWIVGLSSGFAPTCYGDSGATLIDATTIKRGHFVRVYGSVRGNGSQSQPGIYINHNMVELVAYGEELQSGPDGAEIFGGVPTGPLPPGASATPLASPIPLANPVAPPVTPPVTPPAGVQPAPDFVNPTPPPVTKIFNGAPIPVEQLAAIGFTPEQIAALPNG